MPGRPRMRQLVKDIKALPGGEEEVFDRLADGETVAAVAKTFGISRRYMYMWRDRPGHGERLKPMWKAAIRMSAEADLEASIADFDRLDRSVQVTEEDGTTHMESRIPATSEVQLVTGRAKFRQWLAARKDPETYGDRAGVEINLNLGDLHMQAIQGAKDRYGTAALLSPPTIVAEVLDDDDDDDDDDEDGLGALL